MPDRKPLLSDEAMAFVKGNGFQPPAGATVPVSAAPPAVPEPPAKQTARVPLPAKEVREGSVRFTVDMRVSQHKALKQAALDLGLPMTDLARHIVANWLLEHEESRQS